MRPSFLLLGLFSVSAGAWAQQTPIHKIGYAGCPIGFSAQVNARAIARSIEDEKKQGDGPMVEMTFRRGGSSIVSASVVVHGWAGSSRFLPVFKGSDAEAAQSFELVSDAGLEDSTVRPDKVPIVDWVEVTKMKFADGTTWVKLPYVQCRAVVSKFRLVATEAR